MAVKTSWSSGDVLTAADLTDTFASKLDLAGGKILQIVRATDSTNRTTTTSVFADANLSVTITPQKSDSAIILVADVLIRSTPSSGSDTGHGLGIADSSNNLISGGEGGFYYSDTAATAGYLETPYTVWAYATPATTSATTYKLRFRRGNSLTTTVIRNTDKTGQMFAIEVSA